MSSLNLPADTRSSLARFARLDTKSFLALRAALAEPSFAVKRRYFAASIASSVAISEEADVEAIVSALMYLLSYRRSETDLDQFVDDVIAELQVARPGEPNIEPANAGDLKERLSRVLQIDALRLRSKAAELIIEDANVFQTGRIITDIRPVFGGEDALEIRGSLIVHLLKLEFFTASGGNEIYLSMDDDDIGELKRVIERAQRKADVLRSHLKNSKIVDLNPPESSENA